MATTKKNIEVSIDSLNINELSSLLEAAQTVEDKLEIEAVRLDGLLVSGKKCWRQLYNWPNITGRLLGLLKTVCQNNELADEVVNNPTYRFARKTFWAMGQVPFINNKGRKVPARDPDFKLLHAGLLYLLKSMGLDTPEAVADVMSTSWEHFQACVDYAESTMDDTGIGNTGNVETSDCPF